MRVRFRPVDTWFFRESRPHGAAGSPELGSAFPPPARTVVGALRTYAGEANGVDWRDRSTWPAELGGPDDFGALDLAGPYLEHQGEVLYALPRCLVGLPEGGLGRLSPGPATECDLGRVHLPVAEVEGRVASAPGAWLTESGMNRFLAGGVPTLKDPREVFSSDDLVAEEPRLGIARDNKRRRAEDGLLYQVRHLRSRADCAVRIDVTGLDSLLQPGTGSVRFGGEGRLAEVEIGSAAGATRPAASNMSEGRLLLVLATHADLAGRYVPPGLERRKDGEGADIWAGELNGVAVRVLSACIGKAVREGGWDQVHGRPRPMRSLVPAGSVWFCRVEGDAENAVRKLHRHRIGEETRIGRGELLVGTW